MIAFRKNKMRKESNLIGRVIESRHRRNYGKSQPIDVMPDDYYTSLLSERFIQVADKIDEPIPFYLSEPERNIIRENKYESKVKLLEKIGYKGVNVSGKSEPVPFKKIGKDQRKHVHAMFDRELRYQIMEANKGKKYHLC